MNKHSRRLESQCLVSVTGVAGDGLLFSIAIKCTLSSEGWLCSRLSVRWAMTEI